MNNPSLVITTAISPNINIKNLALKDESIRKWSTKSAIYAWLALGIKKIILVDATNKDIFSEIEMNSFKKHKVEIEQIKYSQNSVDIVKYGKGFGEALLLKYAIENSLLLQQSNSFYKCTGKLNVPNFWDINSIIENNNLNALFWRWSDSVQNLFNRYADTRFYWINKQIFINEFLPAFLSTNEEIGRIIESQAYEVCERIMTKGTTIKPIFNGLAGGDAKMIVPENFGSIDNSFPCWYF